MEMLNRAIDDVSAFRLLVGDLERQTMKRQRSSIYDQPKRQGENREQFRARVRAEARAYEKAKA
jgi:hypothetical protein